MAKIGKFDKELSVMLTQTEYSNLQNFEYELREARSEIARHHRLITDMREALEYTLPIARMFTENMRAFNDTKRIDEYTKLLNRQVS